MEPTIREHAITSASAPLAMISYRVPTHRTNHFVMTYGRYLCFKLDFTHFKRVNERGCNSMVQGSRKFLDISVGSGIVKNPPTPAMSGGVPT